MLNLMLVSAIINVGRICIMSYHEMNITKHSHTSPYKLIEESQEFIDALAHGNPIMAIQELSDLYGCIKRETEKLGFTSSI